MRLAAQFVPVRRISTNDNRENHNPEIIEKLAQAILVAGGLAQPLWVRRNDPTGQSYTLLEGELGYWAAVRAREIDLRKGEMVAAHIKGDDSEKDEAVALQMAFLAGVKPSPCKESVAGCDVEQMSIKRAILEELIA